MGVHDEPPDPLGWGVGRGVGGWVGLGHPWHPSPTWVWHSGHHIGQSHVMVRSPHSWQGAQAHQCSGLWQWGQVGGVMSSDLCELSAFGAGVVVAECGVGVVVVIPVVIGAVVEGCAFGGVVSDLLPCFPDVDDLVCHFVGG